MHATHLSFHPFPFICLLFKHFLSIHSFCTGGSSFKKLFKDANMNLESEKKRNCTPRKTGATRISCANKNEDEDDDDDEDDDERTRKKHICNFMRRLNITKYPIFHFMLSCRAVWHGRNGQNNTTEKGRRCEESTCRLHECSPLSLLKCSLMS